MGLLKPDDRHRGCDGQAGLIPPAMSEGVAQLWVRAAARTGG
jgi:hypothetical protein